MCYRSVFVVVILASMILIQYSVAHQWCAWELGELGRFSPFIQLCKIKFKVYFTSLGSHLRKEKYVLCIDASFNAAESAHQEQWTHLMTHLPRLICCACFGLNGEIRK